MPTTTNINRPTPITLVTTELRLGGAEKNLVNLAIGLNREMFSPTVVSLMAAPPDAHAGLVERLASHEIPTEFLNLRSGFTFPRAILKLRRLLLQTRPKIVQSFLFHANGISSIARNLARVPHHVGGIRVADPRKARHRIERWLCRKTDQFVCVSKSVETFSAEVAGLPTEKLLTIHNGLDLDSIDKTEAVSLEEFGISDNRRAIAFVGRLHEQKGLAQFLEHGTELFQELPEHDLLIVGGGPLRSELEAFAAGQTWGDRVHFVGWQPDPLPILTACDALVLPSLWEGMPNAVMEAMALRKPVAAFSVEGVNELFGEQASKQTCSPGDQEALVNLLSQIVSDQSFATSIGSKNRQRIENEFTLAKMIARYEELYTRLLGGTD